MARVLRRNLVLALLAAGFLPPAAAAENSKRLVVHEWGTFTALQDDYGRQVAGINVDDEPLPQFVHNLNRWILSRPLALPSEYSKGLPPRHPYVTVRLETPVIYFYPPQGQTSPLTLDVDVSLRGGWLTEFYPLAEAKAPGLTTSTSDFRRVPITSDTTGSLSWKNLSIGSNGSWPSTEEHVWLAPRKTAATPVGTSDGEAEKYLFYRGVGNFDAPLAISRMADPGRLDIRGCLNEVLSSGERATIRAIWLVHIRPDGKSAFRRTAPVEVSAHCDPVVATLQADFAEQEYEYGNIQKLEGQMRPALVAEGLFEDEARAMLETWNRAYFQKPGLRVFFTVPRVWTDARMPLSISAPAEIQRVMVGRIELKSPEQRALLKQLAHATISDPKWVNKIPNTPNARRFMKGDSDFGDLGVPIPADYRMYLDLGRFRNALVVAEARQHPSGSLSKFIAAYKLADIITPPVTVPSGATAAVGPPAGKPLSP